IQLQRRKVDALERLRRQWLSGERKLPDLTPVAPLQEGAFLGDDSLGGAAPVTGRHQGDALPPLLPHQLPTGQFEHYTTPHARFRSSSPVVAAEMLSFRLKGGKSRSSSGSGGSSGSSGGTSSVSSSHRPAGGVRSGFLNVFAYLHADGLVRLRDADGEEIVAFDSGHGCADTLSLSAGSTFSSPPFSSSSAADADFPAISEARTTAGAGAGAGVVVVGMVADASEAAPVIVTAGADGTARVHSLAVHYRDRQVAGAGRGRGGDSSSSGDKGASGRSSTSRSNVDKHAQRGRSSEAEQAKGIDNGGSPPPSTQKPPATAMGVGVVVEFKTCLGSACRGSDGMPLQATEAGSASVGSGEPTFSGGEEAPEATAEGLPPQGQAATVTSMDAFYHRSLGTTVVVAGYSSGGVRFFHAGNGTELGSADTGRDAVLAVKRGGQSIAFSDGEDVHFVSTSKFTRTPGRVCRGGRRGGVGVGVGGDRAAVTALAFDAVSTAVLYVGFDSGEVMAYDSRFQEVDSSYSCLPSHQLPPPLRQATTLPHARATHGFDPLSTGEGSLAKAQRNGGGFGGGRSEGGCDSISSIRGYTIVSRGPVLSVYNTTDDASRLLFTRHTNTAHGTAAGAGATAEGHHPEYCRDGVFDAAGSEGGQDMGGVGATAAAAAAAISSGWKYWSVMPSTARGEVLLAEAHRCS
ncbi:unnamed protein product, partial [Hapterophycus canaliculatus]